MEPTPSTIESAEDMTAADTAPIPMIDTTPGQRYCNTIGSTKLHSAPVSVAFP